VKAINKRINELVNKGEDNSEIRHILRREGYDRHSIENALHGPIERVETKHVERSWFWHIFYTVLAIVGVTLSVYKGTIGLIFLIYLFYLFVESVIIYFLYKTVDYEKKDSYTKCFFMSLLLIVISITPFFGIFKFFIVLGLFMAVFAGISGTSRASLPFYLIMFTSSIGFTMLILEVSKSCANHFCI